MPWNGSIGPDSRYNYNLNAADRRPIDFIYKIITNMENFKNVT